MVTESTRDKTSADPIRRGIVVVHGVGDQQKGDQLNEVVEPIVGFLGKLIGYENVHIVSRTPRGNTAATATLQLTAAPNGEVLEEWHFREAWWARTFRPSDKKSVLTWSARAYLALAWNIWRQFRSKTQVCKSNDFLWQEPHCGRLTRGVAFFNRAVVTLFYLLSVVFGSLVVFVLYLVLVLPTVLIEPLGFAGLQRKLVNMFTGGIGDQQAMTNRSIPVAAASGRVVAALAPYLDPERLKKSKSSYDTVTLISHSGGCVVSYVALVSENVRNWYAARKRRSALPRITWFTIGSGLNLAWLMKAPHDDRDSAFWNSGIGDHVNWIDMYAAYDPVAMGAAPDGLVKDVAKRETVGTSEDSEPSKLGHPYYSVKVVNDDWPLSDHGSYWTNKNEVLPRFVAAIVDSTCAKKPIRSDNLPRPDEWLKCFPNNDSVPAAPATVGRTGPATPGRSGPAVTNVQDRFSKFVEGSGRQRGVVALTVSLKFLGYAAFAFLVFGRQSDLVAYGQMALKLGLFSSIRDQIEWLGAGLAWGVGAFALLIAVSLLLELFRLMLRIMSWWIVDEPVLEEAKHMLEA